MPHAIIEYSGNIEEEVLSADICDGIHGVMLDCGLFKANDIKTRAYCADDFMVGDKGQDGTFIHVTVRMLEGRTAEQKKALSQAVFDRLQEAALEGVDSISVDLQDMSKECYRKIGD